jgi:hypothetical protein
MSPSTEPTEARAPLSPEAVERALARLEGGPVELLSMGSIADDRAATELKHIGYGEPALLRYRARGEERRAVLHTMAPNWFGHDRRADRAALVLLAADTFHRIPRHSRVLDVGAVGARGELLSLAGAGELYLLTTYAEGTLYAHDLRRVEQSGIATELDLRRVEALARYLVDLHRAPIQGSPELYTRAIRDLLGSGEGIFGIADSYPANGPIPFARLEALEQRCLAYRWKLRDRAHRLRQTHGDFHPYNLLFREGCDFTVLDASRGCVGDPADDLAALTINYVFGAVVYPTSWSRGLRPLWERFWSTTFEGSADREVCEVIPPFFAWRALVVASPVWYPTLLPEARDALLSFAERLLDQGHFDPAEVSLFLR